MRVSFERSGGFTGIPLTIAVDTDTLSPDKATQLRQLVESSDFFHLPPNLRGSGQSDRFQYRVKVEENGQQHEVIVDESVVTDNLKPLLDWLLDAVRQRQR